MYNEFMLMVNHKIKIFSDLYPKYKLRFENDDFYFQYIGEASDIEEANSTSFAVALKLLFEAEINAHFAGEQVQFIESIKNRCAEKNAGKYFEVQNSDIDLLFEKMHCVKSSDAIFRKNKITSKEWEQFKFEVMQSFYWSKENSKGQSVQAIDNSERDSKNVIDENFKDSEDLPEYNYMGKDLLESNLSTSGQVLFIIIKRVLNVFVTVHKIKLPMVETEEREAYGNAFFNIFYCGPEQKNDVHKSYVRIFDRIFYKAMQTIHKNI